MGVIAPPWVLAGTAFCHLRFFASAEIGRQLPAGFSVVNCWPGATVGGIVVARYGPGSTLEYSELIEFGGIVRYGRDLGLWVSRIFVDSEESVAGGREIWGLPKELAEFDWSDSCCTVRQGDGILLRTAIGESPAGIPIAASFPTLSVVRSEPAVFRTRIEASVALPRGIQLANLRLTVEAPVPIGR